MDRPEVTKIRIEYADGTVKEASGPNAEEIYAWWIGGEMMQYIHGVLYNGPTLEEVKTK